MGQAENLDNPMYGHGTIGIYPVYVRKILI